ncbi:hypothetical protein SAMN04515648_1640 [Phyllobacterium sp. CL33Tsu]|uniref:hypothetical protein n=1 Tax=Phyllobacterium sp. CL33Tsu TaxID=1798191 RepID=UPI0008E3AB2B|nr:hypothetical protein [Phyllobacterium sp. CL33Tsu]SFI78073.1 hypothetical protein SAMN04515648_1640 [Phyllobacterium sp. CL33Tsu]
MALSNAERQRRHRERQKQKLAAAAPDLATQYENVGADLREKLYALIDAENAHRERYITALSLERIDFSRVILDIALNEDRSGIADTARIVLLQALCMGESTEKEIIEALRQKALEAAHQSHGYDSQDQIGPLAHYMRVPNFG